MSSLCPVCGNLAASERRVGVYDLHRCPTCGLGFAPDAFGESVSYEATYKTEEYRRTQIDAIRGAFNPADFARLPTYRAFFERALPENGRQLLDVGCGVGRFCHAAKRLGWMVNGIDVSAQAVAIARGAADFPVRQATLDEVVLNREQFDVVTAFEVVEHLAAPVSFLRQAIDVLRPGGLFFCTVPNGGAPDILNATRLDWLPPVHLCFYRRAALRTLGARGGLERVATGFIREGAMQEGLGVWAIARYVIRRLVRRFRQAHGLWMSGRKSSR